VVGEREAQVPLCSGTLLHKPLTAERAGPTKGAAAPTVGLLWYLVPHLPFTAV
jgi:hypothetical protein